MQTTRLLALFASLLLVAAADPRNNARRHEPGRVIIYQHAGYSGAELVLYPGDELDNLARVTFDGGIKLNDSISSIRVEGDVEVYCYENARYLGEALRLTESARDLTGRLIGGSVGVTWNDRISSLRVERRRDRDRPPAEAEGIIKATFTSLLGRAPAADELRDFRNRFLDQGWNERMLRDHLRTAERYRDEAADTIIRRAYREVLERDVDESGLRHYRMLLIQRDWTDSDVRDDLRKSAEYRAKRGR